MPRTRHLAAISRAEIKRWSGFEIASHASIEHLREGNFRKINKGVAGDAPKDFLRIYTYGEAHKTRPDHWPAYIAKVGQKWYPNESVTEHLLTRIGQLLGLN